jgi:hypothetical protein
MLHARTIKPFSILDSAWGRKLWSHTDVSRRQVTSVSRAKKAIADYKKALGDPAGVAELMVYYCEQAAEFSRDVSHDDAGYFDALVRMFEQALKNLGTLTIKVQGELIARLERVRDISREFGYGVGDDMDVLLSEFVPASQRAVHATRSRR